MIMCYEKEKKLSRKDAKFAKKKKGSLF